MVLDASTLSEADGALARRITVLCVDDHRIVREGVTRVVVGGQGVRPQRDGAEYIAVCLPAFSPGTGNTSRLEAPLSATTIWVSPESRSHSSETV